MAFYMYALAFPAVAGGILFIIQLAAGRVDVFGFDMYTGDGLSCSDAGDGLSCSDAGDGLIQDY